MWLSRLLAAVVVLQLLPSAVERVVAQPALWLIEKAAHWLLVVLQRPDGLLLACWQLQLLLAACWMLGDLMVGQLHTATVTFRSYIYFK